MNQNNAEPSTFQESPLAPGIRLLVASTPKFKRTRVMLLVHDRLDPARASMGALLPFVQKRGTETFPTGLALERAAGDLYDAELSGSVHKVGDRQLIAYSLDIINDRYAGAPVFDRGLELLHEMAFKPLRRDGGLDPEYVAQERRFQVGRVHALVNNKIAYAHHRCIEEMFRGEPFAEYELGTEEGILQADPKTLLQHHQSLVGTRPVDVYVVGDVDPHVARGQVESIFAVDRGAVEPLPRTDVAKGTGAARRVTQEETMQQGWLVLGLRTDISRCDPDRYGMLFFNGILGGFVHSKLFVNVREKAGLAYSASSSFDGNKGVLLAMTGIDVNQYDQALEIMQAQIDDTVAGRFTDEELEATRKALHSRYRLRLDSTGGRILFHVGGTAEGCPESIDDALTKIEAVKKEDILSAAERLRLDMMYFLKGV